MKTLNVMLSNLGGRVVPIGYEGENLYTRIRINCIEVFSEYPDATVSMVVNPPTGDMYPAVVEKSGVMVIWDITDSVLSSNGSGECQLTFTEGDVVRKSVVFGISINRSLVASGEAPEPVQEWIDKAEQTAQEIAENAAMLAKQDIVESYGEIAPAIIETAEGAIATISDGADGMLVKTLTVEIDPVQDLHGQDSPYPAGGSPQIWDEECVYQTERIQSKNYIPVLPETTYYRKSPKNIIPFYYDSTYTQIGTGTWGTGNFTTPANTAYMKFQVDPAYGDTYKNDISINYPATETAYYSYSNICPISGWDSANVSRTGINLYDTETLFSDTSKFTIVGNAVSGSNVNIKTVTYHIPSELVGEQITFSSKITAGTSTSDLRVCANVNGSETDGAKYSNGNTGISSVSLTPVSTSDYVYFKYSSGTYDVSTVAEIQLEVGSSVSSFASYQASEVQYEFPSEAGTVYGGELTIHQDGTGELVVDRASVDLGNLTWNYNPNWNGHPAFYVTTAPVGIEGNRITAICEIYKCVSRDYLYAHNEIAFCIPVDGKVSIRDSRYSDATTYKTAMSGVLLVYELATPVSYQLTNQQVIALLKGSNNVWADTGDVALEYPADTKLYIDGKIAELQALILENISNS